VVGLRVVVLEDLIGLQPVVPRVREPLLLPLEVVLDVTLTADVRAHLLPRRAHVRVVIRVLLQIAHAFDERRARDAQRHRGRVMAVDACDRMRHELAGLEVGHVVDGVEALPHVAVAHLPVRHHHRGVAVQARAGLLHDLLPLGVGLVEEHVRVAALLAEVLGERVARPHDLQARVFLEPRLGHDRAGIRLRRRVRDGLAAAEARAHLVDGAHVAVELHREVLSPLHGIDRVLVQRHDAVERVPGLGLALEDVHQQRGQADGNGRRDDGGQREEHRHALPGRFRFHVSLTHFMWPTSQ
jgi:hypothetical protein